MTAITVARPDAVETRQRRGVAHIPTEADRTRAICGKRVKGIPTRPGTDRCVVCLDLARRGFIGR